MKAGVRALLFGLAVWAVPFAAGMAIFPWVPPETALFDTLMAVAMSLSATIFAVLHFRRAAASLAAGLGVGAFWAVLAVALDAPFFFFGLPEMRMSVADYAADIGLAYLMIPIIAAGVAHASRRP
jgi:hypothetical protein